MRKFLIILSGLALMFSFMVATASASFAAPAAATAVTIPVPPGPEDFAQFFTKCANARVKALKAEFAKAGPKAFKTLVAKVTHKCLDDYGKAMEALASAPSESTVFDPGPYKGSKPISGRVEYAEWIFDNGTWFPRDPAFHADRHAFDAPAPWDPTVTVRWVSFEGCWYPAEVDGWPAESDVDFEKNAP